MKTKFATNKEYEQRTSFFRVFASTVLFVVAVITLTCVASLAFAAEPQQVAKEAGINGWQIAGMVTLFILVVIGLYLDSQNTPDFDNVWIGWGDRKVEAETPKPWHNNTSPFRPDETLPKPTRPAPPMPECRPHIPQPVMETRREVPEIKLPEPAFGRATDLPEDRRRFPQPPEGSLHSTHRDDLGVFMFGAAMRERLKYCREVDNKHGWWDPSICDTTELVVHLKLAMRKGDVVDIANLCMMLHQRGQQKI